jgi:septum formation inhibitor MinC
MKVKQKSIRVFEIECEDILEFEAYLNKNGVLLNGFLLLLKGDTNGAFAKECKKRALCYAKLGECDEGALLVKKEVSQSLTASEPVKEEQPIKAQEIATEAKQEEQTVSVKKTAPKQQASLPIESKIEIKSEPSISVEQKADSPKTIVITRNLRSGEAIETDSDVTVVGRINSGAKVKTSANATILEVVDGDVEVWGDYLMIRTIGKGTVTFRGEQIKKESLDGKMKLITFDGKLSIKDI